MLKKSIALIVLGLALLTFVPYSFAQCNNKEQKCGCCQCACTKCAK